jgi:hypothetical protein
MLDGDKSPLPCLTLVPSLVSVRHGSPHVGREIDAGAMFGKYRDDAWHKLRRTFHFAVWRSQVFPAFCDVHFVFPPNGG